ncbi:MAG: exo-beta-N-acetylmuramidase NamZ domain-containing protein, partial [Myxococcota bacterium]|nr:exo-beta-N-acetylmuramidase NamZ domain-containing protein [Myxococcota bacterium]
MRAGLDVLLSDTSSLKGARVGLCCNHTAVTRGFDHALPALTAAGVSIRRVFGPEHGVDSTAQDMSAVDDGPTARTDTPAVVSLYGDSEASL